MRLVKILGIQAELDHSINKVALREVPVVPAELAGKVGNALFVGLPKPDVGGIALFVSHKPSLKKDCHLRPDLIGYGDNQRPGI